MSFDPVLSESSGRSAVSRVACRIRNLGRVEYVPTFEAMQRFTAERDPRTPDELWILEHPSVYTQGQAGKPEHLLFPCDIPVVQIDRGGQITYHGPGQVIVYTLVDLTRRRMKVRAMVDVLEQAVIRLLGEHGVTAEAQPKAPGVYVNGAKIASLGLRVRHGACYHGVALNVDVDLTPFQAINPCGYPGLVVTRTLDCGLRLTTLEAGVALADHIQLLLDSHS